ncbi:MpV17 mitochondrial inner membrane protein [Puccinia graminis f. sp. tritici]|nr:MpV17 mitochondrial inner membrane protein [Puccinia graminis f. sp. tritici]
MGRLGRGYLRLLQTYTLPTQMATAAVIFPIGDAISQHLIDQKPWKDHNYSRTLRSITYGTLAWAPIAYKWNKTLNRITYPTSKLKTVLCRVGIDMALFTSFATCYFFTCMGFLEGRTWHEIKARIERNYSTVVWTNIGIFGPAQIINMSLVPVYGRPPFLNLVSLGYNCFLATVNNNTPSVIPTVSAEKLVIANTT